MKLWKNETGRSMVEMLGVLAIIGVLSVAGIAGYTMAMEKYKANEILNQASMLSMLAKAGNAGNGKAMGNTTAGTGGLNDAGLTAAVTNVDMAADLTGNVTISGTGLTAGIKNAINSSKGTAYTITFK